jgi:hypothetical protein
LDRNLFYLLFIPGLALVVLGIGFGFTALAYTQGPFQSTTKRGLLSMTAVVVIAVALAALAFKIDHPALPRPGG